MIDQTLTTPPDAPSSNDIPTFRTRFDAFIVWIVTFVSQLTTVISQMNSTASTINEKEASAVNASIISVAAANFKGTWNALSNVLANESYVYNGIFYRALQNSVGQTPPDTSVNYQNSYWVGYGATLNYIQQQISQQTDVLKDVSQNIKSTAYTLALTDRGKSIDTTAGVTVPLNTSVAFPIGSVITITNTSASAIPITQTSGVTLRQAGTTNTGNRTLAAYGMATLRKVATDTWFIGGAGVS